MVTHFCVCLCLCIWSGDDKAACEQCGAILLVFPACPFLSFFADHTHFTLSAVQIANTSVPLLSLCGVSGLPMYANATKREPKRSVQYRPYLFIYVFSGTRQIDLFSFLLFHVGFLCVNLSYLIHSTTWKMILFISIGMLFFHMMSCKNLLQEKDFACLYYLCKLWCILFTKLQMLEFKPVRMRRDLEHVSYSINVSNWHFGG